MSLCLSSNGLKHLNIEIEKNFRFIVNNKPYETNKIIAQFLSSKVKEELKRDESLREFRINVNGGDEMFSQILRLCCGESIAINENNRRILFGFGDELGNPEICEYCLKSLGSISINNVCERLLLKEKYYDGNEEEYEFLATHFYEIEPSQMEELHPKTILRVINKKSLRLKDEDSLLVFLIDFSKKYNSKGCEDLFNYVKFEHISRYCLCSFFEYLKDNIEIFNSDLCEELKKGLCFPEFHRNNKIRYLNSSFETFLDVTKTIVTYNNHIFQFRDSFDGIISYLSRECNGNPIRKGIIKGDSTRVISGCAPCYIAELGKGPFATEDEKAPWIYLDFDKKRIKPTHYTLRSNLSGSIVLRSWVVEISNTGKEGDWHTIDERKDNRDLIGPGKYKTFTIENKPEGYYQFIRLMQTGKNHSDTNSFSLDLWEIFGELLYE